MKDIVKAWNNALTFLYDRIDYERRDTLQQAQHFKLDRMHDLMQRLGNPEEHLRVIHVAGTKGKGSTSHMVAAVLQAAGLRCGLYTSPHLEKLEERFVIAGNACSNETLIQLVDQVRPAVEAMDQLADQEEHHVGRPTFFEITTAIALLHFHQEEVDLAILEVGLGGRLDSTNICHPCISVITSISYDHMHLLGNTLHSIATEKAGIIKPGIPVISGVYQEEPRAAIQAIARQQASPVWTIHEDFHVEETRQPTGQGSQGFDYRVQLATSRKTWSNLEVGLQGAHQRNNAAVALAVLACLETQGWTIPEAAVYKGLAEVRCPARIETVSERPTVLIDTAHNPASIESLVKYLVTEKKAPRRILVFATSNDKDVEGMLRHLLPVFDVVILTRYTANPRALNVVDLEQECQQVLEQATQVDGEQAIPFIESCEDPTSAWHRARELANTDDLICITGSFYLAGEIRRLATGNHVSSVTS